MTMGLDVPGPGSSIFQAMLSDLLQVRGTPLSALTPRPPGPRNCGQSDVMSPPCAPAEPATPRRQQANTNPHAARRRNVMRLPLLLGDSLDHARILRTASRCRNTLRTSRNGRET